MKNRVNSDFHSCLTSILKVIPSRYAQWLSEDPAGYEYRVLAAIAPSGVSNYEIAHRTGVIGQVFRIQKPILIPDVTNHGLYDPFDPAITWELCFPLFRKEKLEAVVNLEGTGTVEFSGATWKKVCTTVRKSTGCLPPPSLPRADDPWIIRTSRIVVRAANDQEKGEVIEFAEAIANCGQNTLLVGDFPKLLRGRLPSLIEAEEQGLGPSYCYFGFKPRLDLLATGQADARSLLQKQGWWETCNGRYAFVLLCLPVDRGF